MPPRTSSASLPVLGALLCFGLALSASSALAEDVASAEALFNKGVEEMKAGRFDVACKAIAESQRLDPRPGTLYTLATCEAAWGHIASAVTRYGDYIALYEKLPDAQKTPNQSERYKSALDARKKLLPDVPQLTLMLPKGAPPGTVVTRDGEVVSEAALGLALPVDPGDHLVTTQAPGGPVSEERFSLAKGEKKTVTPAVKEAPAPTPTTSAVPTSAPPAVTTLTEAGSPRLPILPLTAFGAGLVGLGVGLGFGIAVLDKRYALDVACPSYGCPASEKGHLDEAKALSYVSTAGFVLAGLGAATGTVLLLLPSPAAKPAKVGVLAGAGYVGVQGSF